MDMTRTGLMTTASLAEMADFIVGDALICPATRTIEGPGGSTQVEPRVMQVLIVLAEAGGGVVTRDTLLARCWGGFYAGDDSLNRAIGGVRRVASSIGCGSFEVETIPRTGYRLVTHGQAAPLVEEEGQFDPTTERTAPPSTGVSRRWVVAGGAAAVAAGGLAFWRSRPVPPDAVARLIDDSQTAMRLGSVPKTHEAIALLERAVSLAPGNAEAWGLLALTKARADEHAIDRTMLPAGEVANAANRALELDRNNADASAALAISVPYYGDWYAGENRFDAVLRAHPNHLYTMDSRCFLLGAVGRMRDSARDRMRFSGDADAFDANLQYKKIYTLWFLDRIAEADRTATRGLEMWPGHGGIWFGRLWVLASTGRFDRAMSLIADPVGRPALPQPMLDTLRNGIEAAKSRDPSQVDAAVRQLMAGVTHSVTAVINAMMLLNLMGATDKAFELSEAYYLERGPILAAMEWRPGQPIVPDQRRRKTNMLFTPTAAAMQKDERFMPMMESMGLTDYWRRRGILPDFLTG